MFTSISDAEEVLRDISAPEQQRTAAAHFLGHSKSPAAAQALVDALEEDDYGVHWAASEGLATLGEAALAPLLRKLVRSDCTPRVIHGAKHVFHLSKSSQVRAETSELLAAMHGSGDRLAIMQAASNLMVRLHITE